MTRARPARHPAADRGGPVDWSAVERILVVRTDNLGDVVMLTPVLRALRRAVPRARIDLLASPAGAAAAPLLAEVRHVITESVVWQQVHADVDAATMALAELDLVRRVAAGEYDAMLVFTSPTQSPWPAAHVGMLAGIPVRAVHSAEFGGAVATHWISEPPAGTHQVDRGLHLLEALGVPAAGRALELRLPSTVDGLPDSYVLLAPGGSAPAKRYPAARFATVAGLLGDIGLDVLVTGTPREHRLIQSVVDGAGGGRVRALEGLDVPALAAVVARADVVLCNNSACMHLADALGVPVVVTYSGTERRSEMRPRTTKAELLHGSVPCAPCRQFECPYGLECLDIDPEDVARAALRLAGIGEVCPL
ncbi:MAG TPA: glycosyltransferase family 9 protein [Actinophytocola sp.]|uniref:glycosyltransferase family 9 protein n=1 Tax=Actinophytocola sp. TaxID=1872138 RepID=UPI002DDDB735|nr:glycosyltransferase family 9 protein [Actinophytocola sp.]HEV2778908.1 glycosyltransferase family 9 protein [Actinophytocola sp.]